MSVKRAPIPSPLRTIFCLVLLVAAGVAVHPTVAETQRVICPACFFPRTFGENFDSVTPPVLPVAWLATNAQGPPPLWVISNSGVPSPPANTPPNAAFIDAPAGVSHESLDSRSLSFSQGSGGPL